MGILHSGKKISRTDCGHALLTSNTVYWCFRTVWCSVHFATRIMLGGLRLFGLTGGLVAGDACREGNIHSTLVSYICLLFCGRRLFSILFSILAILILVVFIF